MKPIWLCPLVLTLAACPAVTDTDGGIDAGATDSGSSTATDAGASDAGLVDTVPPTVVSTTPASAAVAVATDAVVSITFSEAMSAMTLASPAFTLKSAATTVAATISVTGATATLTPDKPLDRGTTYTATVTTDAKDLAGNALAATHIWTFTTHDRTWSTPVRIDPEVPVGPEAGAPQLVVDGAGVVHAVWTQQKEGESAASVWANRFTPGVGWTGAVLLESETAAAVAPKISVNFDGLAFAVWRFGGGFDRTMAARFTPTGFWESVQRIDTGDDNNSWGPRVVVDNVGHATVMFADQTLDGAQNDVSWIRYTLGMGWGTPTLLETAEGQAYPHGLAVGGSGLVFAAMTRVDGAIQSAWVERSVPGNAPEAEVKVSDGIGNAEAPQLAVDANGKAIAIWHQSTPGGAVPPTIYANRYAGSWGTPVRVDTSTGGAYSPRVAFAESGEALAMWQEVTSGKNSLVSARHVPATGWSAPGAVEQSTGNIGDAWDFSVGAGGDAIAVWQDDRPELPSDVRWSHRTSDGAWSPDALLETGSDAATSPVVVVDRFGNATAVWIVTTKGEATPAVSHVVAARLE